MCVQLEKMHCTREENTTDRGKNKGGSHRKQRNYAGRIERCTVKEGQAQKHANDKRSKSDMVIMGAEIRLSQRIPHEWKHTIIKFFSASCQVMITTAIA